MGHSDITNWLYFIREDFQFKSRNPILGKMTKLYLTVALVLGTLLVAVNGLTINVNVNPANGQRHFIKKHYSQPPTELGDSIGGTATVITEVIGQGSFKVNENNPSDYANGAPVAKRRNVSVNVKSVNYTWREAANGGVFCTDWERKNPKEAEKQKIKKKCEWRRGGIDNNKKISLNGDHSGKMTKLYLTVALVLGTLLVAVNGLTINVNVNPA